MGMLGLAGASLAGGLLSGRSASKAAREASERAMAESQGQFEVAQRQMEEAAQYLESIGVPPLEAQKISLEYAQLGPSALEDIQTDPRLKSAQMDALSSLQEFGKPGMTDAERAEQMMITRGTGAEAQARDKAILQSMSERGMGGSGAELIARLQGSQSAADRASVERTQLAGQAQNRALQAMMQAGQLGSQIRGQEFGEQSQVASAKDRIAQFNALQRAQAQQQQEMHNKQLIQRQFENEMAKRQAVAGAKTGTAQASMQRAAQTAQAGQARAAGEIQAGAARSQLIGGLAGAGIGALGRMQQSAPAPTAPTSGGFSIAADGGIIDKYQDGGVAEQKPYTMGDPAPNNNGGFAGGGFPVPDSGMDDDSRYIEGDVVPGNSFEGDRVDAKINSGEMVLNVEQQQRLMDLLRGFRDLSDLGDDDIVSEPSRGPSSYDVDYEGEVPESLGDLERGEYDTQEGYNFASGGMVPSEYKTPTKAEPPSLHEQLQNEQHAENYSNLEAKKRKSRMKALETLINGGE